MRTHARVSRSSHESADALSPTSAGFSKAIVNKIQLRPFSHQILRLQVTMYYSFSVHAFHNDQQLQCHLADIALGVLLQLAEITIQQLHLHKESAFPLLAEIQLWHSFQTL